MKQNSPELNDLFRKIQSLAEGKPLYLVGGFLRDRLLNRPNHDLDFAILGDAEAFAQRLAQALKGSFIVLDPNMGIYRVALLKEGETLHLDVSACQGKTIQEDLGRRDFTANAMALSLGDPISKILDPYHGKNDIKKSIVRQVSSKIFEEDPIRLLRAFRFAAQWDAKIEPETFRTIQEYASRIPNSSGERIREELFKLFLAPQSHKTVRLMDQAGLLTKIFPELEKARDLAMDFYPKIGVLGHVLNSLERLEEIFQTYPKRFPKIQAKLKPYFEEKTAGEFPRSAVMKLAALLHDIGKPATAQKIEGRTRFLQHDEVGQGMAEKLLNHYRFSRKEESCVGKLVRAHMRPGNLAHAEILTDKAIFRFFRDLQEDAIAMLIVSLADHQTYLKPKDYYSSKDAHVRVTKLMLERLFFQEEKVKPKKLVDGNFLMMSLNLPPGPLIGEILNAIQEAQAEGKVHTPEEALSFAQTHLSSKKL